GAFPALRFQLLGGLIPLLDKVIDSGF
ncbi:MAG: hypothetical protein ACJASJ_000171, partial [Candidatus Azotimanducaceae bacterium]